MGSFKKFITEAVGIETVKKALVGQPIWDYKNELVDEFGGKFRKVIGRIEPNIERDLVEHPLYNKLEKLFVDNKYILTKESYIKGYVTKDKQQFKIGKLLQKWSSQQQNDIFKNYVLELLESFRDDPLRQTNRKPYLVVVSKHPYDVLGASTDRNWVSCINLGGAINYEKEKTEEEKRKQMNADRLVESLHQPMLVSYMVDPDDVNAQGKVMIQRPLSRILIYPFKSEKGNIYNWSMGNNDYGLKSSEFVDIVREWVEELNIARPIEDGIFKQIEDVFYDDYDENMVRTSKHPEEIFEDLEQTLTNIDIQDGIIEEWNSKLQRPEFVLHGLILNKFIRKEHMQSELWSDHMFYDDFIIPFITQFLAQTDMFNLFGDHIDYMGIFRIYDDTGSIHMEGIPIKFIDDYVERDYGQEDALEEYGPYYQSEIFAQVLKMFDNTYDYYKNLFNDQFKNYIEELSKLIQDELIEAGIDPNLKNWEQIDRDTLYSKSEVLKDDIRV
jgi:hypothetical protein